MTEITDQDRHAARVWAKNWQGDQDDDTSAAARYILANVPAPAPTLAERLQYRADLLDNGDPDGDTANVLRTLATDTVQVEHDLAEAHAEVDQLEADRDAYERMYLESRAEATAIAEDLAGAESEVDRLTAERDGAREEIAWLRNGPGHTEVATDLPDPADVKPGEAWIVECHGERRTAVKDRDDDEPWNTFTAAGLFFPEENASVTLLHRLVPAPRVITNPHDLDRLPRHTVILSADNDAWQKSSETSLWASAWWTTSDGEPSMWASDRLCDEDHPVTVLWEPGA